MYNYKSKKTMLKEKAGVIAGQIWEALNETEGKTQKQLKKAAKLKADKDLFLGLGWLLREDKIETSEVDGELFVKLK
jgi:hypothetical protein